MMWRRSFICSIVNWRLVAQTASDFRTSARLVTVDVTVRQRQLGPALTDLTAFDFLVRDGTSVRTMTHFEVGDLALDLVLLVDVTGSRVHMAPINHAVDEILASLSERDQVRVIRVDSHGAAISAPVSDFYQIRQEIREAWRERSSRIAATLYSGVTAAATLAPFEPHPGRRPVLLALTHNQDQPATDESRGAVDALLSMDAAFCAVVVPLEYGAAAPVPPRQLPQLGRLPLPLPKPPAPSSGIKQKRDLKSAEALAQATAGEVVRLRDDDQAVRELFRRLRNRYVLGFSPADGSAQGEFHRIAVELSPNARRRFPEAVVSHRSGYYFR